MLMRMMALALGTILGDTQPATHHGEPREILEGRVLLWDVSADILERERRVVPSLAGHASGRERPASGA